MQTYIYVNADGSVNRRVTRSPDKKFRQYGPNGKAGVSGCPAVIYNLPNILRAIRKGETVWIAEGEKDADTLIEHGLAATTNPQGAGQWKDTHSEFLIGAKRVNICYDNDRPGIEHAIAVANSLETIAEIDTHAIKFYRAATGNDVTDHVESGLLITELVGGPPVAAHEPTAPSNGRPRTRSAAGNHPGTEQPPAVFQLAMLRLTEFAKRKRLPLPRHTGTPNEHSYEVCCPAHDDRSPSLGIKVGDTQPVVVNCQAGCSLADIALALDINPREFSQTKSASTNDDPVQKRLDWLRADQDARQLLANERTRQYEFDDVPWDEYLVSDGEDVEFTVTTLHPKGSNSLLIASAKSGKTTLLINLQRSLSQGTPFAEHFETRNLEGRIAYLEFEMIRHVFRTWIITNGVPKLSKIVVPQHLRGKASPFVSQVTRDYLIDWLGDNDVEVLIIDPVARAWQGIVDNENDNSQVAYFTHILDEVKSEAGVVDLIVATHTGRTQYAQDEEHARGATRLEDWADSLWYYMKDPTTEKRSLRAIGRQVELAPTFIDYNPDTLEVFTSGVTRAARHEDIGIQFCVDALADLIDSGSERVTTVMLRAVMPQGNTVANSMIIKAIERGYIERRKGPRRSMYHRLTEAGLALHKRQTKFRE